MKPDQDENVATTLDQTVTSVIAPNDTSGHLLVNLHRP